TPFSWIMALQIISVVLFTVFFSEGMSCRIHFNLSIAFIIFYLLINSEKCKMLLTCFAYESSLFLMLFFADGTVVKSCSASCGILSVNVGQLGMTSRCCDSDLCNNTIAICQFLEDNRLMISLFLTKSCWIDSEGYTAQYGPLL
uniref:Snake toxin/toxin-like domain-containing protein n=1 Tax=Cyprinus carpio TaxID=7962 RepID=A0A8C2A2H1_CYPCA